ncbi:MAG: hypothetical protein J6Y93_01395 [Treponema sp.]|nr:hypothetical protein [Treponema sp.]
MATLSSAEKAALRDKKSANRQAAFDKLPKLVQLLIGLVALGVICAVGFGFFFAVDILLLDLL